MLTKLKTAYKKLLESKEFKNEGILSGAFLMCDMENLDKTEWQLDFYNKESDRITTYNIGHKIELTDNSEVFKDENMKIEELDLEEIKVNFEDIKEKLKEILEKRHEDAIKITIILQKQTFPIWNIIYITKKFNLLNIKINAINSDVIEEKAIPLLSFEKTK